MKTLWQFEEQCDFVADHETHATGKGMLKIKRYLDEII